MKPDKRWISPLATAGYLAKGIVHGTIGYLAAKSALGEGGKVTGSEGAVEHIGRTPMGEVPLIILGAGLLCHGIFRLLGAFADVENEGSEKGGIAQRVGYLAGGVAYLALAALAFGGLDLEAGGGREAATAKLMAMPFGPLLVGAAGAGVIVGGIFQWLSAAKRWYAAKFQLDGYPATKRAWIERIARTGLISRGVVMTLIGWFLIQAALQSDSSETKGIGGALRTLSEQPFGPWILGITAIGLVCYGIFCGVLAFYGRWHRSA
ncbi:DUF1206 domain-containing protein [Luteolibacter marinus]|uniref:DUF1206 domain-containing protein n=1 Tax=Luteolibacter marinus TaxID=2776705 RepID=UPI0018673BBB|nr:DUF1206 domain-containing protein [Luteolibacter marinus]